MHKLAVIALAASACGSLVDADYAGEPILRLQAVATQRPTFDTPAGAEAAAVWQGTRLTGAVQLTRLPLESDFPAFWIDILERPDDEAMMMWIANSEPAFAEAYLHIVRGGPGPVELLATEYDHVLVWSPGYLRPGSLTADYFGAALDMGFHIMTRQPRAELTVPQQKLVERCVATARSMPEERARAMCTAQHLYQLAPAPDDLATLLEFRSVTP